MLDKKIRSFGFAFRGLRIAWREEDNFRFHMAAAALATVLGVMLSISRDEWLFLVAWFALMLTAETFNTAFEELCDMVRATHDPHVAKIKDLAAAAVLISSFGALITGGIIFLPRIFAL